MIYMGQILIFKQLNSSSKRSCFGCAQHDVLGEFREALNSLD